MDALNIGFSSPGDGGELQAATRSTLAVPYESGSAEAEKRAGAPTTNRSTIVWTLVASVLDVGEHWWISRRTRRYVAFRRRGPTPETMQPPCGAVLLALRAVGDRSRVCGTSIALRSPTPLTCQNASRQSADNYGTVSKPAAGASTRRLCRHRMGDGWAGEPV